MPHHLFVMGMQIFGLETPENENFNVQHMLRSKS